MPAVIFLLIFVAFLVFMDRMSCKFPEEMKKLFDRIINLLPVFDGANADLKSFMFCLFWMAFIIGLVLAF